MARRGTGSRWRAASALALACGLVVTLGPASAGAFPTIRASVGSSGQQGLAAGPVPSPTCALDNSCAFPFGGARAKYRPYYGFTPSGEPAISENARYVAYAAEGMNLDPSSPDTNNQHDVFLHDNVLGTTTRISTDSSGRGGDGTAIEPAISADGQIIAFVGSSGDYDTVNKIGSSNPDGHEQIWVKNLNDGSLTLVSRCGPCGGVTGAHGDSSHPSISSDGRFVAFASSAPDVTAESDGTTQVYVTDLSDPQNPVTHLVSRDGSLPGDGDSWNPVISGDGSTVAWLSTATDWGGRAGGNNVIVSDAAGDAPSSITFGSTTEDVADPAIDYAGNVVAFDTRAQLVGADTNSLKDIYLHNDGGLSLLIAGLDGDSEHPSLESDGSAVAFASYADNLIGDGDTNGLEDVFIYYTSSSYISRYSVDSNGGQANGSSYEPAVSAMGVGVAFTSDADNLVRADTNGQPDVFVNMDLDFCQNGASYGPVSQPVKDNVEPRTGKYQPLVHEVNCDYIAANGL